MKNALIVFAPLALCLTACASGDGGALNSGSAGMLNARAVLLAADGSARGEAKVTEATDGLHVDVRASGLTPGVHAVHIHMTGTCTPPDFTSAGGHWNPTARQHGRDNPAGMHMGDMPNLTTGPDGTGRMEFVVPGATLRSGTNAVLDADGAAIVIHAQADDNKTDPAGNAGGRIACGILSAG